MIKSILVLTLFALCLVPLQTKAIPLVPTIPEGYYDYPCQQPQGTTFYHWLDKLQLSEYTIDEFDCSQRSAYIEWLAENCGHNAAIGARDGHAWVLIEFGNSTLVYEPSLKTGRWIHSRTHGFYRPRHKWNSIYVAAWKHSDVSINELAWWETHPALLTGVIALEAR